MPEDRFTSHPVPKMPTIGQFSWDPLDYMDSDDLTFEEACKRAKADRTAWTNAVRKAFPMFEVKQWTLTGQLKQYAGFGRPDGRVRNVYYVTVRRAE